MAEQHMPPLDKQSYQLEVTRPVWLPYNDTAYDIVAALVDQLGYPTTGPKAERYAVLVASLLKANVLVCHCLSLLLGKRLQAKPRLACMLWGLTDSTLSK